MAGEVLPEGRLVKVEFEVRLPAAATQDDIEDWIGIELGCRSMACDNPLSSHGVDVFGDFILTDTSQNGRREEYGHTKTEDGVSYRVRYVRTPA